MCITTANNSSLIGLQGRVVDETKHTLTIQTNNQEKKIIKQGTTFNINEKKIIGEHINKKIEERIKTRGK